MAKQIEQKYSRFGEFKELLFVYKQNFANAFEYSEKYFWQFKPNLTFPVLSGASLQGIVSNSQRTRNYEFSPKKDLHIKRVLVLGDSTTFGENVPMEESWPFLLEEKLKENKLKFQIINLGVPGYSSWQGLQLLTKKIEEFGADFVIVSFSHNDRWYWDHSTDSEKAKLFALKDITNKSALVRLVRRLSQYLFGMTSLSEKLAGNFNLTRERENSFKKDLWQQRVPPSDFGSNIAEMFHLSRRQNAKFCFLWWPSKMQIKELESDPYFIEVLRLSNYEGFPLVDATKEFARYPHVNDLYSDSLHGTRISNRIVSESLFSILQAL